MIRERISRILLLLAVAVPALLSCRQDSFMDYGMEEDAPCPEGYVRLHFGIDVPDMVEVQTRAVDYDGKRGVESMKLFCFDQYGMLISVVSATIDKDASDSESGASLSGKFAAQVVDYTKIIHLVANQNLDDFKESDYRGLHEGEVMTSLIATSGKMVYWGRVQAAADQKITDAIKDPIPMTRNQARITWQIDAENYPQDEPQMTVTGFYVFNTSAFGTIAPYNGKAFDWFTAQEKYITLPPDTRKATDPTEVLEGQKGQCIFETANTEDDPVSVIIRAKKGNENIDRYYRILLMDKDNNYLPLIRNHSYDIHIVGPLQYEQETLEAALTAPATNNIWVAISDDIKSVSDGTYTLTVPETFKVVQGDPTTPGAVTLHYTYKSNDGAATTTAPVVEWVKREATADIGPNGHTFNGTTGEGTITLTTYALGTNNKLESILRVKAGNLQRTIKVIVVNKFKFEPAWVSTEIYRESANQSVTLMFSIPDNTPEELFPMRVLISTNHLDVRTEKSGMRLDAITKSDADGRGEYFGTTGEGLGPNESNDRYKYKYVYMADGPGVQRVYFWTTLTEGEGATDFLDVEAEFFEKMQKVYTYSSKQEEIHIENMSSFSGKTGGEEYADDEDIYYYLVPQKKNAYVKFQIQRYNASSSTPIVAFDMKDKFLLYSSNLTPYTDDELQGILPDGSKIDCAFELNDGQQFGTGGPVNIFYPREDAVLDEDGLLIHLKTNKAKSDEVVRIASYHDAAGITGNYTGGTYKSITFELANYRPFSFTPTLQVGTGADAKVDKEQTWTYQYQQPVYLGLDITSFKGGESDSKDVKSVDPFGTAFNVYIDAPMLEIAQDCQIPKEKFYEESEGRFVYVVDAKRDDERNASANYGTNVLVPDNAVNDFYGEPVASDHQDKERKILPFQTKNIVTEGTITIRSQEEIVVFDRETFTITNEPITGNIQYGVDEDNLTEVPAGAFVTFERERDGTRIGIMDITEGGQYTLRLRQEYSFAWDEPLALHYEASGKVYHAILDGLRSLFDGKENRNLKLLIYEPE